MSSTELMEVDPKTGEIMPLDADPRELMNREINVAQVARQLIEQCTVLIQGQKHLKFEGWCGLARLTGCMISTESVTVEDCGVAAIAIVKDLRSGEVIGRGEGFVGNDEVVWYGGTATDKWGKVKEYKKRPLAAIRAFAQTRAGARAARMAMSSLVTLMGKEYSPTPAEEMPADMGDDRDRDHHDDSPRNGHQGNQQRNGNANGQQKGKEPATEPAKATAAKEITLGADGRYPSMCTKNQIDNLKALVTSTKSDGRGLFERFGDPRLSTTAYTNILAYLNKKVEEQEGGKADDEGELPF